MSRPRRGMHEPTPDRLAPPGLERLCIRFDGPMDPRRGRVRLVWGRISAHSVNRERRAWRFDLKDPELSWSSDHTALVLELPPGLLDGFRVRVEWSDLRDTTGRPPMGASPGATLSYVIACGRADPVAPPTLTARPAPGESCRPDAVLELYASQPVGELHSHLWALETASGSVDFTIDTNRNPPDWIFVHPSRPLPAGPASLRIPRDGVRGTDGGGLAAPWRLDFVVEGQVVVAQPSTRWSEPPAGFASVDPDHPAFALRFEDRPVLLSAAELAVDLRIEDDAGAVVASRPTIAHDPTPGHYRSLVVEFDADLDPDVDHRLSWSALQPTAFAAAMPGFWRFRTASRPRPTTPLGNAASAFATPEGTFIQISLPIAGVRNLLDVSAEVDGTPVTLVRRQGEGFTPASGDDVRQIWQTPPSGRPLPPLSEPGLRQLRIILEDTEGRRTLSGVVFDMTQEALTALTARRTPDGLAIHWKRNAPADCIHLAAMYPDGRPVWAGLFAAAVCETLVHPGWLVEGPMIVQAWLVRARPEDDLWDFFVDEVEVDRESTPR